MPAAKFDITIDQGSDFELSIQVYEDDAVKDLTDYGARSQLRQKVDAANKVDFVTTGSAFDTTGTVKIQMNNLTTSGITAGSYVYDIEIYNKFSWLANFPIADLADIAIWANNIGIGTATIPSEQEYLLDFAEDGVINMTDSIELGQWIAANKTPTELNTWIALYAAGNYTSPSNIINSISQGNYTQEVTRILQGKATVTGEVTR